MGQNLSKYGNGETTNLSKEMDIDVDTIISCIHYKLVDHNYVERQLNVNDVKEKINSMNICHYRQTNYIYNTKNHIIIKFKDHKEITIAFSDCGNYVGFPTPASGFGIWFYLKDKTNPFSDLIKDNGVML